MCEGAISSEALQPVLAWTPQKVDQKESTLSSLLASSPMGTREGASVLRLVRAQLRRDWGGHLCRLHDPTCVAQERVLQDAGQYWEGKGGNPGPWAGAGLQTTEPQESRLILRRKKFLGS